MWYVYIAEFSEGKLYTGITTDPERRIREHNEGIIGAKSLRGKGPVNLLYTEAHVDKASAAKRERQIKNWHKDKKLLLINIK